MPLKHYGIEMNLQLVGVPPLVLHFITAAPGFYSLPSQWLSLSLHASHLIMFTLNQNRAQFLQAWVYKVVRYRADSNCSQAQLRQGSLALVQVRCWSANSYKSLETTTCQKILVALCFLLVICLTLRFHALFPSVALYRKLVNMVFSDLLTECK